MISRQFIDNFIRLFKEKRYQELIDQSDIMTSKEERPSGLSNLIGLSKNLLKQPSKEYIISSLDDFKEAYLKAKKEILKVISMYQQKLFKH